MTDIIPFSEISEIFEISTGYLIFLVFILGFLTICVVERNKIVKIREGRTLDQLFLISLTGLVWMLRIKLISLFYLMLIALFNVELIWYGKILIFVVICILIGFTILSSVIDILFLYDIKKFVIINRIRTLIKDHIKWVIIFLIICTAGLIFFTNEGVSEIKIFVVFMFIASLSPLVYIIINFYSGLICPKNIKK